MIIGVSGKIGSGKDTVAKIIQYLTSESRDIMSYDEYQTSQSKYRYDSVWKIKKFAGKLKQMVSLLTGIPVEDLEKEEIKSSSLGREWNKKVDISNNNDMEAIEFGVGNGLGVPEKVMTVREMLQKLGTEALRDIIHPNVHINALFADYKPIQYYQGKSVEKDIYSVTEEDELRAEYNPLYPNWLITDVRFPNEGDSIKKRGGIIIRIDRSKEIEYVNIGGALKPKREHPSETSLDNYDKFDYYIANVGTIEDLIEKVRSILKTEKII